MANNKDNGLIRKLTTFEEIDQRFVNQSVSAVVRYIDSLKFPVAISQSDNGYIPEKPKSERTALYQNSNVFLDSGDGRVSKGLRGLELLSRLCKGVPAQNLFLFNNVIYSSNPNAVKNANRDELIDIVINNLGLADVTANAVTVAPSLVNNFRDACYQIGYQVRSGNFQKENVESQMLIYAKKLSVAAARSEQYVPGITDVNILSSPTPTPTATVTPSPSPVSPSPTPTPSVTPSVSVSPTVTPTTTMTPTATVTPTVTRTITPTVSVTPTISGTPAISATPTQTVTGTPPVTITPTATPTATPTRTPTGTAPITLTPTASVTPTNAVSATVTPTITPTVTSQATTTPVPTVTPTVTRTATITPSITATVSATPAPTVTPTVTPVLNYDPYFDNVVLLLNGQSLADSSGYARIPTDTTGVSMVTDSPFGGSYTSYSNNTQFGPVYSFDTSTDFNLEQAFTIEFWYKATATGGYFLANDAVRHMGKFDTTGIYTNGWGTPSLSSGLGMDTWTAVAFCRDEAGNIYSFVNGTLVGSNTGSTDIINSNSGFGIFGIIGRNDLESFRGFLTNIRYTQGVCRYTGNYTLASGPFPEVGPPVASSTPTPTPTATITPTVTPTVTPT